MNRSLRALFTGALILAATASWAHVVVTPKQVGIGAWQTFSVSVPNEKDVATTEVKLVLPEGIHEVTPSVKPGWTITVEKKGDDATAIVWKGQLPAGFRDDFTFSTQAPSAAGELAWKAYQTYQGGVVVKWDADPASPDAKDPEAMEKMNMGPYSVTKVVNDLTPAAVPVPAGAGAELPLAIIALVLAAVAAVLAVIALRRRS
jgi:uncharacterized protein YcnI